jgi:hypothetical protein
MLRGIGMHITGSSFGAILMALFLSIPLSPADAQPAPCFEVRVEFRGREATEIIGNVQFYRWTYRVYGAGCINRAMGTWYLEICPSMQISGASESSVDASDLPGGTVASYLTSFGQAPLSTIHILKWDFIGGNALNKVSEYDEFSFIASGNITTVNWSAKGSPITVSGTTMGPSCAPVASQATTLGGIKSRLR